MTRPASGRPERLWRVLGVCAVLLVAAWLRFDRLSSFPPGLYHDVAYNGVDVLGFLHGHLPIFFTANNGREPLFLYAQAAAVALFGTTAFALRMPSAIAGVLTVAVVYTWARSWFGYRAGLLTAAVMATLLWHVYLSRIGLRVITLPLATTLTLYLLWRATQRRTDSASALAGIAGGVAMYTHIASRLLPPLALLLVLVETLFDRGFPRRNARVIAVAALCWIAVAAPLYGYFLAHQDLFFGHAGDLSYLTARWDEQRNPLGDARDRWQHVLTSTNRVAGMFLAAGDRNPRHNVPSRPVFDPLIGAAFVFGLAGSLARLRRAGLSRPDRPCRVYLWALLWWAVMVFPTALSIDSPHFHRTAGGLPPTCLFAALGIDWFGTLAGRALTRRWVWAVTPVAAAAVLLWMGAGTYRSVWGVLAQSRQVQIAWETSLRDFGEATAAAVAAAPRAPLYVQVGDDSEFMRLDTQFLASRAARWRWIAADQTMLPLPPATGDGLIVAGDVRLPLATVAATAIPGAKEEHTSPGTDEGEFKIPTYRLVRLSAQQLAGALEGSERIGAAFGGQVVLESARVQGATPSATTGDTTRATVALVWRFLPAAHGSYDLFAQLLDADGKLVGQEDRTVASSALAPDERGLTFHTLRAAGAAPPGPYRLIVGVATPDGARRLAPSGGRLPVAADAVVIATL